MFITIVLYLVSRTILNVLISELLLDFVLVNKVSLEFNLPIIVSSANITDIRAVILATGPLSKLTFCFMNRMSCRENRRHCIN